MTLSRGIVSRRSLPRFTSAPQYL